MYQKDADRTVKVEKDVELERKGYTKEDREMYRERRALNRVVYFGKFGLRAKELMWITSKQIEDLRRIIVAEMGRKGKVFMRIFPTKHIPMRYAENRANICKGRFSYWAAVVQPEVVLFEVDGVDEEVARHALRRAAYKLPAKSQFAIKDDGPSKFELSAVSFASEKIPGVKTSVVNSDARAL